MKSPFKFLDSYTKTDREIFFGREREIEELYHRVFESKIMLVYGVSGTGKSSLIHCGLANKFQETDWLPIVIRRGGSIIESMAAGIRAASITDLQKNLTSPADFKKGVRSLYLDHYKPVFLIFDQFEELFIFGDKEERKSFIQIIKSLVESDLQCRLIFVMREEYMAGVTEFEKFIPTFFSNRVRIEKMSGSNALEAIKGPCKVFNINLEDGFAETLLERLSPGDSDIELTYLQVFLDKIFRLSQQEIPEEPGKLSFTLSLLNKTGNVSDLLGSFLDEQISLLGNSEEGLAVLKSFVSVKGTRRQMNSEEINEFILTFGKRIKESDLNSILQIFVNLRILREKDENDRYELRHDALAAKIYEKITLVEKELLEIRQFVENAFSNFEKRKIYLTPEDLNYIAPYEDKLFVNKRLSEFIESSKKNITARKRAFNRTVLFSAIGFLFILISIALYYFRTSISAKSNELTIESFLQKEFSPSLSFQTALNAYTKDTSSAIAIKALFDAFYGMHESEAYRDSLGDPINPQKNFFDFKPCNSNIKFASFSSDGKYIYGYQDDNTVNIWDIKGNLVFSKRDKTSPLLTLKLSPDNNYITAAYWDSTAILWNFKGEIIYRTGLSFDPINPSDIINFSPSGKLLSFLNGSNFFTVLNIKDSSSYELKGHTGEVNGAVFSPDGKFIASASKDSTVIIWMLNNISGAYEKVNVIKDFTGIVWSVDFARNSKYIICVSDSVNYPITLKRITGKDLSSMHYFFDRNSDSVSLRLHPGVYYGRFYSAKFIANDAAIRICSFTDSVNPSEKNIQANNKYRNYDYYRIIFSGTSFYSLNQQNKYLNGYGVDSNGNIINTADKNNFYYAFADVSSKYLATNQCGNNYSTLYYCDRLPIKRLRGTQPCFSPDGNFLLCIDGKSLKLYPANEKELMRLSEKELAVMKIRKDNGSWKYFFRDW